MNKIAVTENYNQYKGEIEFIIKDRNGVVINQQRIPNIIKIYAKEMLSHRLAYGKVWVPDASTGNGSWVQHDIDLEEYSPKYIVFGASYDEQGNPLDTSDSRYYVTDPITGGSIPKNLSPGAEYDGGLINAIPIAEPTRPLKRVERIFFEPSYQPAGTPLLQSDVRALNNTIVFETTIKKEEYNGFGMTSNDFFTLTEVALVGAAEIGSVGNCECDPRDIFINGNNPQIAHTSGSATITLDINETEVNLLKEGDQVKIVAPNSTAAEDDILNQVNPYYLIIDKAIGGRDITLDRIPTDEEGDLLTGEVGLFRDGFRIYSHRILKTPIKKSSDFEIVVRWRIIFN